jgi:hypothetical protein
VIEKIKGKMKWVKSTDCLAGLALFFASVFFFYDLFDGRYLLTERDLAPYFIPPRFFWIESIKHGSFPLWNPYQFSGHPFFANPQHALVYPLNGLFFLLPFDVAFNTIIILHFFLGGLFTYIFLRDLKVNSTGSLISGLIFMLSGYLLSVHSLLTILLSSTWTPLIMMFFRRAILKPGLKNEIFTAIFVTFSFLGGGIEIVYGNFIVLLIMAILLPFPYTEFVGGEPRLSKFPFGVSSYKLYWGLPVYRGRMRSLLIVSVLFLVLSAIQLFPFIELFHNSIRGSGMSYPEATTWSFAPKDVLLFFLPDAYGYFVDMKKYWISQCWFKTLYTGGLPFILSSLFFVFGKDRKLYLALMLFSLFFALGKYNPLYPLVFKYVPFFNGIRYPAKFLYIFILVLSVTAGLGFQKLSEYPKNNENKGLKHLALLFSLVSGSLLLFSALGHQQVEHFLKLRGIDSPDFNSVAVNLHHAQRFLFYLALFFLLLRVGYEVKWKGWVKVLFLVFLLTDLFGNMGFYGKEKVDDYLRKTRSLEIIVSGKGNYRVFSTAKTISMDTPILLGEPTFLNYLKEKNLPSINLLHQQYDIWGNDVIRLKRVDDLYKAFTNTPSISATHLVDLYGVKYITSVTPLEENDKFELIYARLENLQGEKEDLLKENTIKLYKNRSPLPRAWLVGDFKVMDSNAILSMMIQKEFRPGQEVLLEEDPKWINPPRPPFTRGRVEGLNVGEPLHGPQKVQMVSETNNRLDFQVSAEENSLLVLSDTYYPGWKALVDGKETKIYRADYAFRAIPLNAGTHRVEFVYDPISFKLGAGVTVLGILACIGMGWIAQRRARTNRE